MDGREEHTHFVKRVVLPSGKTIEVVYFKDAVPATEGPFADGPPEGLETDHPPAEPDQDLHLCLECGSGLVHPVEWQEAGPENWTVLLRYPNCDVHRHGVFTQGTVERFDEELDRGADVLAADYRRLVRANMADELERFVGALDAGAIVPEDF